MITGVKKISVYDPATGTTVQLNNIVPGADAKIKRPIEILDVDNELYYDGDESFLEFSSYKLEGYDQLEAWMIANTQVQLVVAGIDYNLFWYESAKITVYKNYGFAIGNRNTFNVRISKARGNHSIYAYTNLVRVNGKFVDADANEEVDNFTFTGTGVYAFDDTNLYQQVDGLSGGVVASSGYIIYPFTGINMYAKINRVAGETQNWTFYLQAYNYASGLLGESTITDSDSIINLLLPANTYKIRIKATIGTGKVLKFYIPFLGAQRGNYLDINY